MSVPPHPPDEELDPLDHLAALEAARPRQPRRWALWLLLLPLAAIVYPPLYNRDEPTLGGLPFFVWYQLAAVAFGGLVTGIVYHLRGGAALADADR